MSPLPRALILSLALLLAAASAEARGVEPPSTGDLQPNAPALVRCDPTFVGTYTTQDAIVDLYIEGVTDLYAADVRATFGWTAAQVVDMSPSGGTQLLPLDSFMAPDLVVRNRACNTAVPGDPICATAGNIWYAATQVNPTLPVSGSGPIARIFFRAYGPGTFQVSFYYSKLSNRNGVEIPSTTQNCTVEFVDATGVDLVQISATRTAEGYVVRWETLHEGGLRGFNVYRGPASGRVRLNETLIEAQEAGSDGGAAYEWLDRSFARGQSYWIETVPAEGEPLLHGPVFAPGDGGSRLLLPLIAR